MNYQKLRKPFWQQGDFIQVKTQCFTVSNIWNTYYLRYCFSNWFIVCISYITYCKTLGFHLDEVPLLPKGLP
jgi:hypothetical protein